MAYSKKKEQKETTPTPSFCSLPLLYMAYSKKKANTPFDFHSV
jgi:hypothetical protein